MNNNETDLIIQEYRNMHAQLETINEQLPKIKEFAEKVNKSTEQHSLEVKSQQDSLKEQITVFKETQKAANTLLQTLQNAEEKLNEINSRLDVLENRIGLTKELEEQEKSGVYQTDNKTILERLEVLEIKTAEQV